MSSEHGNVKKFHALILPFVMFMLMIGIVSPALAIFETDEELLIISNEKYNQYAKDFVVPSIVPSAGSVKLKIGPVDMGEYHKDLVQNVRIEECSLSYRVEEIFMNEREDFVMSLADNRTYFNPQLKISTFKDLQWGPGLRLSLPQQKNFVQIFFLDSKDRDRAAKALEKINRICVERGRLLGKMAQRYSAEKLQWGNCPLDDKEFANKLTSGEHLYLNQIVQASQRGVFLSLMQEYEKKFRSLNDEELQANINQDFQNWSQKFLNHIKQAPFIFKEIPLSQLVTLLKRMTLIDKKTLLNVHNVNKDKDMGHKLFMFFQANPEVVSIYLKNEEIKQQIVLRHYLRNSLAPSAADADAFIKKEKDILWLNALTVEGPDKLRVIKENKNRLEQIAGLYKLTGVPEMAQILDRNENVIYEDSVLSFIKDVSYQLKKEKLKLYVDKFERDFNVFNLNQTVEDEREIESFFDEFLTYLNRYPFLVKDLKLRTFVDFLKSVSPVAGNNPDMWEKLNRLLIDQDRYSLILLLNVDEQRNALVRDILKGDKTFDKDEFFAMMKEENDLLLTAILENNQVGLKLESLQSSHAPQFEDIKAEYVKKMEDFQQLYKSAQFRVGLLLLLYRKDHPQTWQEDVLNVVDAEKIDVANDFEAYGRWGAVGNMVKDMSKYQILLQKDDQAERKRYHDILVDTVLRHKKDFLGIYKLMDFASGLKFEFPYLKTSALQEITRGRDSQ